jgi:hypothetical protein
MAATKSHAKPATLGTVLKAVEGGFAAVAEDIADIKSTMATKEDIAAAKKRWRQKGTASESWRSLPILSRGSRTLKPRSKTMRHSKEIDHALERVAGIEKHLGLDKKIAA